MSFVNIDYNDAIVFETEAQQLAAWKADRPSMHSINFYLIPMHWKVESYI